MTEQLEWLLLPSLWVTLGLGLIVLEVVLIGSMVFFLPLGIAALLNGLYIYLALPVPLVSIVTWDDTLVSYAIFSVLCALLVQAIARHRKADTTVDINEY